MDIGVLQQPIADDVDDLVHREKGRPVAPGRAASSGVSTIPGQSTHALIPTRWFSCCVS